MAAFVETSVDAEFCTCGEMAAVLCLMNTGAAVDAATVATVIVDAWVVAASVVATEFSGDGVVVTVGGAGVGSGEIVTGVLTVFSAVVVGVEEVKVCVLEGAAATGGVILTSCGCGDRVAAAAFASADVAGDGEEVADVADDVTDSVDA